MLSSVLSGVLFYNIYVLMMQFVKVCRLGLLKEGGPKFQEGGREARLTFCSDQASVVPNWTAVFKNKDCDGHNSQTHDEHHHPDCWTVWFWGGGRGTGGHRAQ